MMAADKLPGNRKYRQRIAETQTRQVLLSLSRIGIPSIFAATIGFVYFDEVSRYIASNLDSDTLFLVSNDDDSGQFVQNFLVVIDLLFAILAGSAYKQLYQQQESIYFALYAEVSEAKSLLEQLTFVGQARPWYNDALRCMQEYITDDLRRIDIAPASTLSAKPVDDPLEEIMYMTSVGVPSTVYETVRDLRKARGRRLAAFQRKFPTLGIALLYILAAIELFTFPLLGAGTAELSDLTTSPDLIELLELQAIVFAALCGSLFVVLRIIQELWQCTGGVFNVDEVLQVMIFGLEEELNLRIRRGGPTSNFLSSDNAVRDGSRSGAPTTEARD